MKILKRSNRIYATSRFGQPQIRVWHRRGKGKKSPCYTLRCGCCDQKLEVYYSEDDLEIGGVNGAIDDWREILLPLLMIQRRNEHFVDVRQRSKVTVKKSLQRRAPRSRPARSSNSSR